MKIDAKLLERAFLIFLAVLFIYYLYLASHTQLLGEDEATYYYEGQLLSRFQYPSFINNVPNTTPLLVPMSYALFFVVFGSSLALAKMITVAFGFLTILMVYLIGKKVNIYAGMFSVGVLLTMLIFTNYFFLAYVDIPLAFFSALFTYMALKMDSIKGAILTGLVLAGALYTKETGFVLLIVLFFYALMLFIKEKNFRYLKLSLLAIVISLVLFAPFILRNIYLFNYPYHLVFNFFFKNPIVSYSFPSVYPTLSSLGDFTSAFGWIAFALTILGFVYFYLNPERLKQKESLLPIFTIVMFIILYLAEYFILKVYLSDSRYLLILFPQMALIGGIYMNLWKEKYKYLSILFVVIFLFGVYLSIIQANAVASAVRYPQNYIDALTWVGATTPNDSLIFTTYGGSTRYYADRNIIWATEMKEFPTLMTTNDSTYIYNTLRNYNVSYILIWNGEISSEYLIPGSNIAGVFTYNFANTVFNDTKHFKPVYQNKDDIVFKLL